MNALYLSYRVTAALNSFQPRVHGRRTPVRVIFGDASGNRWIRMERSKRMKGWREGAGRKHIGIILCPRHGTLIESKTRSLDTIERRNSRRTKALSHRQARAVEINHDLQGNVFYRNR